MSTSVDTYAPAHGTAAAGRVVALVPGGPAVAALWAFQRRLIYFPDRATPAAPPGAPRSRSSPTTGCGWPPGWPRPTGPDRRIAVLVAPGNAGNRLDRAPLAARSPPRVHRAAAGLPRVRRKPRPAQRKGAARDADAADTYWRHGPTGSSSSARASAPPSSPGSPTQPPAGLVLRSPFESLAAVGGHHYPYLPVSPCCGTGSRWRSRSRRRRADRGRLRRRRRGRAAGAEPGGGRRPRPPYRRRPRRRPQRPGAQARPAVVDAVVAVAVNLDPVEHRRPARFRRPRVTGGPLLVR